MWGGREGDCDLYGYRMGKWWSQKGAWRPEEDLIRAVVNLLSKL